MNQIKKNEINYNNFNNAKVKIKDELVYLINILNSAIKSYYNITKQLILKSKENCNNINDLENIINIEKQLYIFIQKAKDIFSKMKNIKKQDNNTNQLYNYWNNNFFYYSNAPINSNNQLNKIFDEKNYKKISYKSPNVNSNYNINYINNNNYSNRHDIKNSRYESRLAKKNNNIIKNNNICNTHINYSTNLDKKQVIIPQKKLDLYKIKNKDELLKNILILLKQIKEFKGNIFYETNEAQKYKNIFNLILKELDQLIEILSKEKVKNEEYKCLTTRNKQKSETFKNLLNDKKEPITSLNNKRKNIRSNSLADINQTFNVINTRNIFNEFNKRIKSSNSQNIKLKDKNKSIDEQSKILISKNNEKKEIKIQQKENQNEKEKEKVKENNNEKFIIIKQNDISLRNILFNDNHNKINQNNIEDKKEELKEKEKNIELIDKAQQTDKADKIYTNLIVEEEIEMFIENNSNDMKIVEKENIIKDLENKNQKMKNNIISLKQDLSNTNNQLSFFKIDNDKQNKEINDLNKQINLLKKLIDNKNKEEILSQNIKDKKDKKDKKEKYNIISKNNENSINITQYEQLETDRDKISIKYELLKLDYDKQKNDLLEKEKLLKDYNIYKNINESKNVDERICQLIKKHKKEIDDLNEKYTKDILSLKINLPNCFSSATHEILIDKKFKMYDLHWYLLTLISAKNKDYENTFWVSEDEIRDTLEQFNKFKSEEEIEKQSAQDYFNAQQKLIKRIEINEENITKLETELKKYKNNE